MWQATRKDTLNPCPGVDHVNRRTDGDTDMSDSTRDNADSVSELEALRAQVAGLQRDAAQARKADHRLKLLSSAAEQSSEGIAMSDLDGNLLFANAAFASMHGFAPMELAGKHLSIFHTPEQMPAVEAANRRIKETGTFNGEIWHAHRSGRVFPTLMHNTILRDEAGTPFGMIGTVRDITQRKQMEDALQESEQRYRTLFDNAPIGVYRTTPEGRIEQANSYLIELLGYSSFEELAARNLEQAGFEPEYDRREFRERLEREGVVSGVEGRWKRRDGSVVVIRENARARRDADGRIVCYEGTVEDITGRKQAEADLRRAHDELEARVAERTASLKTTNERLEREIAERKQADAALRESERRSRAILDHSFQFIGMLAPDGTLIDANRTALDFAGVKESDVLGKPFWETPWWTHSTELQNQLRDAIRKAAAGHVVRFEATHPAPDGQLHHVDFSLKPVTDDVGNVSLLIPEGRDITKRKRADEALRTSEERLRTIVGASKDAMIAIGEDGLITLFNPAAEQMFGRPADTMLGRHLDDLMPEIHRNRHQSYIESYFKHGKPRSAIDKTVELTALRRDGHEFPIGLSLSIGRHEGHRFALALIRDITQEKRAENDLRESSAKLAALAQEQRVLLQHTRDFVYRHDTEGVFTYVSPAVEQIMGYSVDEWRNHYTANMTDNPINEKVIAYTEETLRTGKESPPYLVELFHRTGRRITLEVNERPYFTEDGRVAGIIGVARDVTERVHADEQLRQAKESAEAANRAKSSFLANMSHEIRTPITALLHAAELLETGVPERPDVHTRVNMILRNGHHLLSLIDGLLDMSRMEAGRFEIRPTRCSLVEIIADIYAVTLPLHQRPNVEYEIVRDSDLPTLIHTDPTRLKQAAINLINNALKFTESGHVHVHLSVDTQTETPFLVIKVEDTGRGIPAADIDRIFEAFTQIQSPSHLAASGVGLGLPLARWITEQLGGTLETTSIVGRGSTFTLRVPTGSLEGVDWVSPEQSMTGIQKAQREGAAATPRLRGRILLAEDVRDLRELAAQALTNAGADVEAVTDGRAALKAAAEQDFDLILMDVRMPGMDGKTAATELRRRGCLTPMIALTAVTGQDDHDHLLEAGFDDVWLKPMSLERLVTLAADFVGAVPDQSPNGPTVTASPPRPPAEDPRMAAAIATFVSGLPNTQKKLRAALETRDLQTTRDILHRLVGTAGTLGFMALSNEAANLLAAVKQEASLGPDTMRAFDRLVGVIIQGSPPKKLLT